MVQNSETWSIDPSRTRLHDPLLDCLVIITRMYHHPFSPEALTAGLPLEEGKLTPDLFTRAADRAGLTAKLSQYSLQDLSQILLPAVLLLKNKKACVLEQVEEQGRYHIIQPESGGGKAELEFSELEKIYDGFCLFIRPAYRFDQRTEAVSKIQPKHWFWTTITQMLPTYSEVFVASLLINFFALASPLFVMNVYDRVVPNHAIETLWVLALGIFIVYVFDFIMRLLRSYFIDGASKRIDATLSTQIFEQILGIQMSVRPRSVGTLANMVHSFEAFREFITSTTISILIDLPFTLLFILVTWSIGGSLAFIPLIAMPFIVLASLSIQIPLQRLVQQSYRFSAEKQATLIESLHGIETIKITGAEGVTQKRWERLICLAAALGAKLRFLSSLGVNVAVFIQHFASVLIVIFGVYKIADNQLTLGGLIACTILTGRALAPMTQVASLLTHYFQSLTSMKALDQLMKMDVECPKGKTPLQRPSTEGNIEFQNVTFCYPEQKVPALQDISFKIKSGERVAIIGRVGSGKTTIEKLIVGLYKPTSGKILLDNTDILQLDVTNLRKQIGYVPQDILMFYGTVKDNIVLGVPYADDASVLAAAKISGLDEFLQHHPDGFDLQIEENGKNLSGGQRQMIAISRALLLSPPLILLDEPTSAMDDKSDARFKENLLASLNHRTLILVTHRASMLSLVDRIIILDKGKLIADGPKESILQALKEGRLKPVSNV